MGGRRAKSSLKWKITINPPSAISQEKCSIWWWFLVHFCKMMISSGVFIFFFFFNFDFLGCCGVKGQKMAQNDKKLCQTSYLRNHTSYDCHLWYTYVKWFFIFSKFLFSRLLGGVKGQKMVQNGKKFCLSHSKSQEPYIMLSFVVHKCKMIMSPGVLFNFSKFCFFLDC